MSPTLALCLGNTLILVREVDQALSVFEDVVRFYTLGW